MTECKLSAEESDWILAREVAAEAERQRNFYRGLARQLRHIARQLEGKA